MQIFPDLTHWHAHTGLVGRLECVWTWFVWLDTVHCGHVIVWLAFDWSLWCDLWLVTIVAGEFFSFFLKLPNVHNSNKLWHRHCNKAPMMFFCFCFNADLMDTKFWVFAHCSWSSTQFLITNFINLFWTTVINNPNTWWKILIKNTGVSTCTCKVPPQQAM